MESPMNSRSTGEQEQEASRALESENKELRNSLSQLNNEIRRVDSQREKLQEELRKARKTEKEQENCSGALYSNESFGGGEEKHAENDKNTEMTVMLQMQAIAIENLLRSLE